jgi:hypothetical protein
VGIRESLNQNPRVVTGVTVAIIVVVLAFIIWSNRSGGDGVSGSGGAGGGAFFSNDDGKSWFTDDAKKVPPFQKDGKDAYRVFVFKCPDGKKFVSHLERYTPEAKKRLEAVLASSDANTVQDPMMLESIQMGGVEVKSPGRGTWIKQSDDRAAAVVVPKCPGGGVPEPVWPD